MQAPLKRAPGIQELDRNHQPKEKLKKPLHSDRRPI